MMVVAWYETETETDTIASPASAAQRGNGRPPVKGGGNAPLREV